jgi:hypothetical protein
LAENRLDDHLEIVGDTSIEAPRSFIGSCRLWRASGAELAERRREGLAIERPVAGLALLPLPDDSRVHQRVGVVTEQRQADPGMLSHLAAGSLAALLSEEIHDAEPRRVSQSFEDGHPVLGGGRGPTFGCHGHKVTVRLAILKHPLN